MTSQVHDPALAAYSLFTQANDAMDNGPDDRQDELTGAAAAAYRLLIATRATSAAGAMAQLQGHLRWCGDEGNEEYEALCRIVADLAKFVPVNEDQCPGSAPRPPVADDFHARLYGQYLDALRTYLTLREPSDQECDAAYDAMNEAKKNVMTATAGSFEAVMLKARTAHHWLMMIAQGSLLEPRDAAELFAIVAADLEVLLAGKEGRP